MKPQTMNSGMMGIFDYGDLGFFCKNDDNKSKIPLNENPPHSVVEICVDDILSKRDTLTLILFSKSKIKPSDSLYPLVEKDSPST